MCFESFFSLIVVVVLLDFFVNSLLLQTIPMDGLRLIDVTLSDYH